MNIKYLQNQKGWFSAILIVFILTWTGWPDAVAQVPTGAINGLFSVSENTQVCFSQGNLQYIGSAGNGDENNTGAYWKFAEHQWDCLGDNGQGSDSKTVDRDLFGWGTSGYNHGATCYQPWSTSTSISDYNAYGSDTYHLFDQTGQADWGYNAISNGGNQENSSWRTLTYEEWRFVFNERSTVSSIRYAKATVNNVNGVVLLPDDWQTSYYSLSSTNTNNASFSINVITASQWAMLEQHGAVFLPAAGGRFETWVQDVGGLGYYWSASYYGSYEAIFVACDDGDLGASIGIRYYGRSVRLVCSVEKKYSIHATPSPAEGGSVSGIGTYEAGTECALTATANEGYTFINWTENGEVVSTEAAYSFTVTGDRELVANFTVLGNNEHGYVDLGLPSGTLWAACNIGADNPEDYGDYFAWGETQPKDNYEFCTYQHCNGSENTLTKYCSDPDYGYNGFIDTLTVLLPEDDAATTNWGEGWRMPTYGQWQELLNNTTNEWTTQNGVNGRLFTASNGNSLFLPAAGYRDGSSLNLAGSLGYYWSSSLYTDYPNSACNFFSNSGNYGVFDYYGRYHGLSVRPVRSGQSTSFSINAVAEPEEGGTVSGAGAYEAGAVCTLTATPNGGYTFVNWTENGEVVSTEPDYSFTVTGDRELVANFTVSGNNEYEGGVLGYSTFDWQSNSAARTWTHVWPDGKVNFAFTQATTPNFTDRGTGIGTYDSQNNEWIPSEGRVENEKTGFGSIAQYGANGLVVAAHTAAECCVYIIPDKDNIEPYSFSRVGALDPSHNPMWPSVMTSGTNRTIIHVIATGNNDNMMYYYRSVDGGQTWDKQNEILPFMGSEYCTYYNSNSCYWMETTDDNCLALVVNNPWNDGMVIYSYDDGETWECKVFYKHPNPFGSFDEPFYYPRWTSCQWDSQHHLHVLYEFNATKGEASSGNNSYYPQFGGVAYWNETMPYNSAGVTVSAIEGNLVPGQPFVMDSAYLNTDIFSSYCLFSDASHAMWPEYIGYLSPLTDDGYPEDLCSATEFNLNSIYEWAQHGSYNQGICSFPVLCMVPGTDEMVAVWSALDENHTDANGNYYYKIFASYSGDGGTTWSPMVHLTKDSEFDYAEFIYNQAVVVGRKLIIATQTDQETGAYVQGAESDYSDNYYKGFVFDIDELFELDNEVETLIFEPFEEYNMGGKIAQEAIAAGHDWWTTWYNAPGSNEDGMVDELNGTQCGHLTYGNDQILLLGDEDNGVYDLEFDVLIPNGKNGYFCVLHDFIGSNSTWALGCYLHMTGYSQHSPGSSVLYVDGTVIAGPTVIYDEWMHFRLHVDTDSDVAEYYYTVPGEEETLVYTWQWSLDIFGSYYGKKIAAMEFFPPQNANNSEFYIDNFSFKNVGGESVPVLSITPESIDVILNKDESTTVDVTIANNGNSIGDWNGWIDFGQGADDAQSADVLLHNGDVNSVVPIGSSSAVSREIAVRLSPSVYGGSAMGMKVVSAQYFVNTYVAEDFNYTFRLYGQGMNEQPGELLAEKSITTTTSSSWISVTFDEPVYLTGQQIWLSVALEQAADQYPLSMDGGFYGEMQDGNFISTNGDPFSHCSSAGNFEGAWFLTAHCEGTCVPNSWVALDKFEGSIMGGQSDVVTFTFNSMGMTDGEYNANFIFNSNDAELNHAVIPVSLQVNSEIDTLDNPMGTLNGLFSVSEGQQVKFSQGNLQYIGSAGNGDENNTGAYWKFAEHQWDCLGDNGQGSDSKTVDRDLFGWSTSGYNHGANCYQPWSTSESYSDYFAYGSDTYNLFDQTGQADWGYNAISNGGNQTGLWRTLTQPEWDYVFNTRVTSSGIRYAKATVNNINGVILLPDDWSLDYYTLNSTNTSGASFSTNVITASQWATLEQHGAVFLPAAGNRFMTSVAYVGSYGHYWSASYSYSSYAYLVYFYDGYLGASGHNIRYYGQSVRLVRTVENYSIQAIANPAEGGAVSGVGTYMAGDECTLTATANEGYTFINWTENGEVVSTEPAYSFTVTGDRELVANFTVSGNNEYECGVLGYSTYDWQSNCAARTWTHVWPDGKVNFAFTQATAPSFSDRGTGIGTYDSQNNEWIPSEGRVENEKTGFGSIAQYGANGLVVAAHTQSECCVYIIPDKDNIVPYSISRVSTLDYTNDPTWPNVMTSGPNRTIIHVIALGYPDNMMYYYRSVDGGQTWDKQNEILPFMGPDYCIEYSENSCYWMETTDDNCLALVVNNPWSDGMVIYSYDDGETWERKVFYKHPNPFGYFEEPFYYPRWTSCQWDSQHHLHVLYEFNATTNEAGWGDYYPQLGGVAYWNETMPYNSAGVTVSAIEGNLMPGQPFVMDSAYLKNDIYLSWWLWSDATHEIWPEYIGYLPPLTNDGIPEDPYHAVEFNIQDRSSHGYYQSGICSFPVLCMVPGTDEMVAVWSALDENHTDASGNYFYKIFASYSGDGGTTWSPMVHLTKDSEFDYAEFIYNQAVVVGRKLIIATQTDQETGTYVQSDEYDYSDNYYKGFVFDIDELFETHQQTAIIGLSEGWNWYSTYIELNDIDGLGLIKEGLGENGVVIKSQNNGFVLYDDGLWTGNLNAMNNESMYLIEVNAPALVSLTGDVAVPEQHPITLTSGWNWIGYPSSVATDINTALSNLTPHDGDMIKMQGAFAQYSDDLGWTGGLNTLTPGNGLMYLSQYNQSMSFVFGSGSKEGVLNKNITPAGNHFVPDLNAYPFNMSVMAVVELDRTELRDGRYELAAFVGDECRGSARLQYVEGLDRFIAFLTVAGDKAVTLRWKLYDAETGQTYGNDQEAVFEADAILGGVKNPMTLRFNSGTALMGEWLSQTCLYPNPVEANALFRIDLPANVLEKKSVEIVNALGVTVKALTMTGSSVTLKAPKVPGVYLVKISFGNNSGLGCKLIVK